MKKPFGDNIITLLAGHSYRPLSLGHSIRKLLTIAALAVLTASPVYAENGGDAETTNTEAEDPESVDRSQHIYRMVDEQGNVSYTDSPPEGAKAERVQLKQLNTMPQQPVFTSNIPSTEDESDFEYEQLRITSPDNNHTYRPPIDPIQVSTSIEPALRQGHRLQLTVNGEPQPSMTLIDPFRGSHALVVNVIDENDEIIKASEAVTIHVHRPSIQHPPAQ